MYSKLVRGEDDLVGLVAYSLYKRAKVAFILEGASEGRQPSRDEFRGFDRTTCLPQTLESYRQQAESLLAEFSQNLLEERVAEIDAAFKTELADRLSKVQPFWRSVWQNVVANLVGIVLTAGIIVAISIAGSFDLPTKFLQWWEGRVNPTEQGAPSKK